MLTTVLTNLSLIFSGDFLCFYASEAGLGTI